MIRTCNGTDPYVVDKAGQPCTCQLTFDDVQRSTVHPHVFIPTQAEKQRIIDAAVGIVVEAYPELARP